MSSLDKPIAIYEINYERVDTYSKTISESKAVQNNRHGLNVTGSIMSWIDRSEIEGNRGEPRPEHKYEELRLLNSAYLLRAIVPSLFLSCDGQIIEIKNYQPKKRTWYTNDSPYLMYEFEASDIAVRGATGP